MGRGGGGAAASASAAAGPNPSLNGNAPPPFLSKTYDMVDDPATDAIVSWGRENNSFVVWNTPEFARDLLPKYFKHNNFSSFVRQLNTYGFRKVDPDRWEFANESFLRGQKHLLKTINRRKSSHPHNETPQPKSQTAACVEVGKFGLEEEIERLKRDKNILMQELVRLRQQQQATDQQLHTLGNRLQGMEQRQQQMMSFLAKAMQSPGFLAQFMQQNDSNKRIAAASKKRRLPKQEAGLDAGSNSPDGQIVKYQPMINEAAKAMLRQILKLDGSSPPRLEQLSNSDNFSLENFMPPSEATTFDSTSSNRNSGVTLAEVPSGLSVPYVTASTGFSAICSSSAASEIQSPIGLSDNKNSSEELRDMDVLSSVPETIPSPSPTDMSVPEFSELQDIVSEDSVVNIPGESFVGAYINPIAEVEADNAVPIETDDILYGDDEQKLPGIIDTFWEQFLASSPISSEAVEEVELSGQEGKAVMQQRPQNSNNGWDSARNMENLTEQMGLLSSDRKG
ncbi:heat stress transcription factor A-1-like isoform X1 [Ananas comosus]|uniref:Heat stress transcription factor A-1-like isoform X1 n=1 Tax=Ananas comosus TaxID=4615 RepID=A0A6P5F1P9_ANACO|nr:heat stress transcription factor A-1-like isoform X1 [Ananas comosus]